MAKTTHEAPTRARPGQDGREEQPKQFEHVHSIADPALARGLSARQPRTTYSLAGLAQAWSWMSCAGRLRRLSPPLGRVCRQGLPLTRVMTARNMLHLDTHRFQRSVSVIGDGREVSEKV